MARVLVVEDNPANLMLMEYLLRAFGHEVVSATDGAAGVTVAISVAPPPAVILMDLQLPTMSGYDAAVRIREVAALQDVPIVAVTALAMVGDRERILAQGFDGYIAKPIDPATFVAEVEAFLAAPTRSDARAD